MLQVKVKGEEKLGDGKEKLDGSEKGTGCQALFVRQERPESLIH